MELLARECLAQSKAFDKEISRLEGLRKTMLSHVKKAMKNFRAAATTANREAVDAVEAEYAITEAALLAEVKERKASFGGVTRRLEKATIVETEVLAKTYKVDLKPLHKKGVGVTMECCTFTIGQASLGRCKHRRRAIR